MLIVFALMAGALSGATTFAAAKQSGGQGDAARLKPAYRFERSKWVYVHLEGSPSDIGYQHGYLLAPEIDDGFKTVQVQRHPPHQARLGFLSARPRRTSCGRTSTPSTSRSCRASPTA